MPGFELQVRLHQQNSHHVMCDVHQTSVERRNRDNGDRNGECVSDSSIKGTKRGRRNLDLKASARETFTKTPGTGLVKETIPAEAQKVDVRAPRESGGKDNAQVLVGNTWSTQGLLGKTDDEFFCNTIANNKSRVIRLDCVFGFSKTQKLSLSCVGPEKPQKTRRWITQAKWNIHCPMLNLDVPILQINYEEPCTLTFRELPKCIFFSLVERASACAVV